MGMRLLLLLSILFASCTASAGLTVAEIIETTTVPAPATPIPPLPVTETPKPTDTAEPASIYPYQSAASIAQAATTTPGTAVGFDWGLDYVQWVVGWADAVALGGTDGDDSWGSYYRSTNGEIYVEMHIVGTDAEGNDLVAVSSATTVRNSADRSLDVEITDADEGWVAHITTPDHAAFGIDTTNSADQATVTLQFASAMYERPLLEPTVSIPLPAEPESWGIVQVSYLNADGAVIAWHSEVVPTS